MHAISPFRDPNVAPHRIPMRMATGTGMPTHVTMPALTQPATAITEPTERSIPPRRITSVMPHAKKMLMVICRTTLKKFALVAKLSVRKDNAIHMMTSPIRIPRHSLIFITSRVNPKFCVNAKLRCKIEQKCFKAGAAQAAAAFSTKITALRGDVKGGGVSLRSSRLLTFRLQPVSPACGRQRTPLTVRELRSSPAAFRSTSS